MLSNWDDLSTMVLRLLHSKLWLLTSDVNLACVRCHGGKVCRLDWTPIVLEEPDLDSDEEEYDWRADLGDSGGGDGGYDPSDPKAAGRTPTRAEQLASDSTHSSGRLPDAAISAANPAGTPPIPSLTMFVV